MAIKSFPVSMVYKAMEDMRVLDRKGALTETELSIGLSKTGITTDWHCAKGLHIEDEKVPEGEVFVDGYVVTTVSLSFAEMLKLIEFLGTLKIRKSL